MRFSIGFSLFTIVGLAFSKDLDRYYYPSLVSLPAPPAFHHWYL